jgi:hypothetical protein
MMLDDLRAAAPDDRRALLVGFIETQLLEILEWPSSRRSELARGFVAIGFDSLMSVDLQYRLQTALHFAAESPDDFRQPSVEALADHLLYGRLALNLVQP